MDEKLIPVKTETRLFNCSKCNEQIKIVTQTMGDQKFYVFEFQYKMIRKFEKHETLYLRDTSESTKRHYPYFNVNERIITLQYSDLLRCYVMEDPQTDQPIQMSNQFVSELIRGIHVSDGYEIIDIYGNTKEQ